MLLLHTILKRLWFSDRCTDVRRYREKKNVQLRKWKRKGKKSPPCCCSPVCSSHFSKESVSIHHYYYYYYQPECRQTFTTCCSGSSCLPSFHTKAASFDGSTCCKGHHLFSLSVPNIVHSRALFFMCEKGVSIFSRFPLSVAGCQEEAGGGPWPPAPPCTPTLYIVASTEGPAGGAG